GGQEPSGRDERATAVSNWRITMKTTSTTNLIACAVIAGAFTVGFVSGPAFAEQDAPFKFEFNYSPNELTSVPQAEALLIRLEQDVRRHCQSNARMTLD